ncbi:MAG: DMT family protein [Chitinophagales bacterium]|nr:DMT family protein [Bacteroidota bacterium]
MLVKSVLTIVLLTISNAFMTLAWYGHLKFNSTKLLNKWGLFGIIFISWLIAFFEYCFQVPANRIGFQNQGGPFSLFQLKLIQEVISLAVFTIFAVWIFKTESFRLNHFIGFVFLVLAVYFIFKK